MLTKRTTRYLLAPHHLEPQMFWLFEGVQAHSHGHGHSHSHELDSALYLSKENLVKRTNQIQELYQFIANKIDTFSDPFPLSVLPERTRSLVKDLAESHSTKDARFAVLELFFGFSPLINAISAALYVSTLTNILIRVSPNLEGWVLDLLVSFAEGSILGNVFLHLMPESYESASGGWGIISGFLAFCLLDKTLKIVGNSVGHVQTHTHSHSHGPAENKQQPRDAKISGSETKGELKKRSVLDKGSESHQHDSHGHNHMPSESLGEIEADKGDRWIYAALNVAADFAHNITDGVALAAAFHKSTGAGITAFILMILHEVPHQFGDFALLMQGGASKAAGLQAQMVASSGTVLGCVMFGAASSQENLDQILALITPFTAGVFLYIGTVGVLPELLEVATGGVGENLQQSFIQATGVISGLFIMSMFS